MNGESSAEVVKSTSNSVSEVVKNIKDDYFLISLKYVMVQIHSNFEWLCFSIPAATKHKYGGCLSTLSASRISLQTNQSA